MITTRRQFVEGTFAAAGIAALAGCANQGSSQTSSSSGSAQSTSGSSNLKLDSAAWQYNSDDDVYYQIGISYCEKPADESYEKLALFVPGAYMSATDNGDGTFTCKTNESGSVGSFTPKTAPIVMPINTPGYSAQSALSEYSSCSEYTSQGFVYAHAGCRGRDHGAPAGVTDLKAAVRFMRFVADQIPANTESIFTFGMSGGGAQSAIMGATGDATEYEPYLEKIGSVSGVSDAILGSMDWCPITGLDCGDAAYEWMMGCTRSDLDTDSQAISDGLAAAFATYINGAKIRNEEGSVVTLETSSDGIYQAGGYYDCVKAAIETSLNNFLSDTTFPYDSSSSSSGGMGGGGGAPSGDSSGMPSGGPGGSSDSGSSDGSGMPSGGAPSGEAPSGSTPGSSSGAAGSAAAVAGSAAMAAGSSDSSSGSTQEQSDDISRTSSATALVSVSGSYDTAADYIAALNGTDELGQWVTYDESSNTATITSVEAFARAFKPVSKDLGAFDQLDRGQGENTLFGYGDGSGAHFDQMLADVLADVGSSYASDYAEDLARKDDLGNTASQRVDMYTPLYYLLESAGGYQASTPASHWRIRSGIAQSDTSLTTELNLALALKNDKRVSSVDFAAVWGQQHTQAERTGSANDNFVAWVKECLA